MKILRGRVDVKKSAEGERARCTAAVQRVMQGGLDKIMLRSKEDGG